MSNERMLVPGGGPNQYVTQPQLRDALSGIEQRTGVQLEAMQRALNEGSAQIQDLIRVGPRAPGMSGPGAGLGNCANPLVLDGLAKALREGCCVPDFIVIDIPVPGGVTGQAIGAIVTDTSGPNLITNIQLFARISPLDPRAADWASSLFQPPTPACPTDFSQFELLFDCGSSPSGSVGPSGLLTASPNVFPVIDVRGAEVPIGFDRVRALCCGTAPCQVSVRDANGSISTFTFQRPLLVPDHPTALDGEVELFTNNAAWQYAPIPVTQFREPYQIADGGRLDTCGFLACMQQLTVAINVLRAPMYDLEVKAVFSGYRFQSCTSLCTA